MNMRLNAGQVVIARYANHHTKQRSESKIHSSYFNELTPSIISGKKVRGVSAVKDVI
ncbi:hypothetical protein [Paenibacillus sp. NPDC055715]